MGKKDILSRVDYTLLKQTAIWEQIERLCREGLEYTAASAHIPPCYVKQAKDLVGDKLTVYAVIGLPNGSMAAAVKVFETEDVTKNGADEIDMITDVGLVKAGHYDQVLDEIRQIKVACDGRCLKVIIRACLLTKKEKKEMYHVVTESGADFIKTSARFSAVSVMPGDVTFMRKCSGPKARAKAAGGITSVKDAQRFVELGADRLGTSRLTP